ncbi:MAG: hypothetical protein IJR14_01880 [Synergistaceae bacterium]|nr:hypothetical protein [Synergistaceae bacterium]
MGVTVVPYSPWKEQLAASFLFPLLHGAIERQRQRDDNRKMNALLGELSGGGESIGPTMDGGGGGVPQGGDAWERSFWQNEGGDRLAAFDSAVRQPTSQGGGVARLMQLMNSERFGMVDPKLAQSLAAPYIQEQMAMRQAAEQAAAAQQAAMARQAWGDQWMGTTDPAASLRQLILGSGAGHVDKGVVKDYVDWMKHAAPHQEFKGMDLGDRKVGLSYDPITGQVDPVFSGNVGMTPYQAAQTELGWAGQAETGRWHDMQRDMDARELEERRQYHSGSLEVDRDRNTETQRHNKATEAQKEREFDAKAPIEGSSDKWTDTDKKIVENLRADTKAAKEELAKVQKKIDNAGWTTTKKTLDALHAKKAEIQARIDENERQEWEIGRRSDPNNPVNEQIGRSRGWLKDAPAPQTDNTLKAADVAVKPDAGTATMDVSPQDGTQVAEELDPAKNPELAAMDAAVSGDVRPQAAGTITTSELMAMAKKRGGAAAYPQLLAEAQRRGMTIIDS